MTPSTDQTADLPGAPLGVFDRRQVSNVRDALGRANLDELLNLLLADFVKRPVAITAAAMDRDWSTLQGEAHILLGSARCVGADAIADCLIAIENAARERNIDHGRIAELEHAARHLHDAIVDYRRGA